MRIIILLCGLVYLTTHPHAPQLSDCVRSQRVTILECIV